jgi:hypothetical protein
MTPDELRLECLKLVQQTANASGILLTSSEIISRARAYANFVMDRDGHGSVVKANGAQNPELAAEERFRIPVPPPSQFERGALARAVPTQQVGPPNSGKLSSPRRR